jgi:hypothetical protein
MSVLKNSDSHAFSIETGRAIVAAFGKRVAVTIFGAAA